MQIFSFDLPCIVLYSIKARVVLNFYKIRVKSVVFAEKVG